MSLFNTTSFPVLTSNWKLSKFALNKASTTQVDGSVTETTTTISNYYSVAISGDDPTLITATTTSAVNITISGTYVTTQQPATTVLTTTLTNLINPIQITTSDGNSVVVFDTLRTALQCLEFMQSRNQYYMVGNDDIMIINVSGTKLLIVETTFLNQKLINSFNIVYSRGKIKFIHRNLATVMSVTDALISVGYKKSSTIAFQNNFDLQGALTDAERPRIQVVDINYIGGPINSTQGALLEDLIPLTYK